MSDEFIDTYSDDILYLIKARKVLLTYPFSAEIRELCNAVFCRLLIVFIVGSIETMLKYWYKQFGVKELETYFKSNIKNKERVQALYKAFQNKGINADIEVLNDYLAIKYLRNTICHGEWREQQRKWCKERGFPTDTRKFIEDNWYKILEVEQNMMMYIALTKISRFAKGESKQKLKINVQREELKPMIITRKDLSCIILKNLENIAVKIDDILQRVIASSKHNPFKDLSLDELSRLSEYNKKIMFYSAVKRVCDEGFEEIKEVQPLMEDMVYFWKLYKKETFDKYNIDIRRIKNSTEILDLLFKKNFYIKLPIPWNEKTPRDVKVQFLKSIGNIPKDISENDIVDSLDVGKIIYDFMPDITLVILFAVYLPLFDIKRAKEELQEIEFILYAWKLNRMWYYYIEHKKKPDLSYWNLYKELFSKFIRI